MYFLRVFLVVNVTYGFGVVVSLCLIALLCCCFVVAADGLDQVAVAA